MDKLEFENFEVQASDQNGQEQLDDARTNEEQAIKFSSSVIAALEQKAKEHNDNYTTSKVTLNQLKKVYRNGASAQEEKGLHAMARVNMFLKMKRGGKVKQSYRAADGDI